MLLYLLLSTLFILNISCLGNEMSHDDFVSLKNQGAELIQLIKEDMEDVKRIELEGMSKRE